MTTKCPGCGTVAIFAGNDLLAKTSLAAATTTQRQVVIPLPSYRTVRNNTIKIVVATSGKKVSIDGLATARS